MDPFIPAVARIVACCICTIQALFSRAFRHPKVPESEPERRRGRGRAGRGENFFEALDELAGAVGIVERQHASRVLVMKSMHEIALVGDREGIVNALCVGQRLVDADRSAAATQQPQQSRAVADDVVDVVQHDLYPVGTVRQQEVAQQLMAPCCVEAGAEGAVEYAQPVRCPRDHRVERGFVIGGAFEARVARRCVVVHGRGLSVPSEAAGCNST